MNTTLTSHLLSPHRPPDWPWQLAKHLQKRRSRTTRPYGDARLTLALRFATELDAATDELQHFAVASKNLALYQAWSTYQGMTPRSLRWELEARLLAAEPHADIAKKTGHSPAAVEQYAAIFFDVADQPPGYITHVVIGDAAKRGVSEREPDVLWKMFGYWCGPIALDFLIYGFNRPTKPQSPQDLAAFFANDTREHLQFKAWLEARAMQINGQKPTAVMNLYLRMLKMENRADTSGVELESMKAGIQGLLESLPWTRDAAAHRSQLGANYNGADMRADEEMLTAAGQRPPNLDALLASAVYPPRTQRTTVSN